MYIRKATLLDLDDILEIKKISRDFMIENNNPNQWIDDYPQVELLKNDIEKEYLYVVVENEEICAFFAFILGEDETYKNIYNGKRLNDEKYGTIHRVATNHKVKGIFKFVLNYCLNVIPNIRIDTYKDNFVMLDILKKNHFVECGTIYVDSSKYNDRIAFQYKR